MIVSKRNLKSRSLEWPVGLLRFAGLLLLAFLEVSRLSVAQELSLKVEKFDRDPGWDGFNNHVPPTKSTTVTQDYGYESDAIGGRVVRSARPTYYADKIAKTLNDKLSASGNF